MRFCLGLVTDNCHVTDFIPALAGELFLVGRPGVGKNLIGLEVRELFGGAAVQVIAPDVGIGPIDVGQRPTIIDPLDSLPFHNWNWQEPDWGAALGW